MRELLSLARTGIDRRGLLPGFRAVTYDDWIQEGEKRFGPDRTTWPFVCPVCGHVATPREWLAAGASKGEIAFSCIGRHLEGASQAFSGEKRPCTYAGGGLFRLNPVLVLYPDAQAPGGPVRTGGQESFFEFAQPQVLGCRR